MFSRPNRMRPLVEELDPFAEELATPRRNPARGARQHERPHSFWVAKGEDLRYGAAHRPSDHVGPLDAFGVEHGDHVGRHGLEVIGPARFVRQTGTAVVRRDASIPSAEGATLADPAPPIDAETHHEQQRLALRITEDVVGNPSSVCRYHPCHDDSTVLAAAADLGTSGEFAHRRRSRRCGGRPFQAAGPR